MISSQVVKQRLLLLLSSCSSCSSSSRLSSFLPILLPYKTIIKGDAEICTLPPQLWDKVTSKWEVKVSWASTLDSWSQGRRQSNMLSSMENQYRETSSEFSHVIRDTGGPHIFMSLESRMQHRPISLFHKWPGKISVRLKHLPNSAHYWYSLKSWLVCVFLLSVCLPII